MNKLIPTGYALLLLFITCSLSGQDISKSEKLIGKWYLLESNVVGINDTITLSKKLPQSISKDYYQWEFTDSGAFFTTYYKHSQTNGFVAVAENKMHNDVWSLEKSNNHLTIKNENFKHVYNYLLSESGCIKLIILKRATPD